MSNELDIKVAVLGFHPKHGELISAKAAKEVIEGIQEQVTDAIDEYKTLFSAFESCQDELKKANERADKAERTEKIATLAAQDMNLEKSIALGKVQKLEKTLGNCADGLAKANERVKELEEELATKELLHVGFTNGSQIKYAKVEEGSFYPNTDGNCYIPLYMLKSHEHRIETTSIEQLRKEQD